MSPESVAGTLVVVAMTDITYENISPLIAEQQESGSRIRVTFRCPQTGATVQAVGTMQRDSGLAHVAKQSVKRNLMWSVRRMVAGAVRSALGSGMVGRVGQDMARSVISGAMPSGGASYSDEQRRAAIVRAFESVASQFVWQPSRGGWVAASATGEPIEFSAQLSRAPVAAKYDRGILARMLIEIAAADGQYEAEEMEFIQGFIAPDLGTVQELASRPPLSPIELQETTKGAVRQTMVMVAWAVAFADGAYEAAEGTRIQALAQGLELSAARFNEAQSHAQAFVMEQAFQRAYASGRMDPATQAEVHALAARIGMAPENLQRAEIRYRKRAGLL